MVFADYPIVSHRYLADPASLVHNGRVYLFASNDDDNNGNYQMRSIVCVSSSDLKNWTDHGVVFEVPQNANWAGNSWAPSIVERNGKFYLYFGNNASNIGVAVADSPTGPFVDPLGSSLVDSSTPGVQPADNIWIFDPMAFVDDDGQAYLYFGGNGENNFRVIKLNDDMISVDGAATRFFVPYFFEAAWMHKYNGTYYFSYSTNPGNGIRIDYMTSTDPMSGFMYQGIISGNPPQNDNNNNHHALFEFKGEWYQAYHNRVVASEAGIPTGYKRNLAIDKIVHQSNGTISQMQHTVDGLSQLGYLNPFIRVEAETMDNQYGIETEVCSAGGMNIAYIEDGDWVKVRGVDFGAIGADGFSASVASITGDGFIEVRLNDPNGEIMGTLPVPNTGGYQAWETHTTPINRITGVQDVYFVFKGASQYFLNMDHWQFQSSQEAASFISLEAECGEVGSLFNLVLDSEASEGSYVTVQSGNNSIASAPGIEGRISYALEIEESGSYALWGRTIMPTPTDDSFWVRIDEGAWFGWNNVTPHTTWTWNQVNSYSLSSGTHTLTIGYREDGAFLDKLFLTQEGDTPSGQGAQAANCEPDPVITVRALGADGSETLALEMNGVMVANWTLSTSFQHYTYSGDGVGTARLHFTNDAEGKDVQVDYLDVFGSVHQAEDQPVNTAFFTNDACGGGGYSELMHCNGYIEFSIGRARQDTDGDGTDDCSDSCPTDPDKVEPELCGCGIAEGACGELQFAIAGGNQGIAACKAKYVGNIMPSSWQGSVVRSDFNAYWNQVTPENAGKWGVVEGTRDNYNWGDLDQMYDYTQQNNIPFKHHVFVWGAQQPNWLASLSAEEQRAEVEEWYSLFAQRYPNTAIIDVVNESLPGHAPDVAVRDALGGFNDGANNPYLAAHPEYGPYGTGWDYLIYSFAKARAYFPEAILILNDYGIINSSSAIAQHLEIVNILKERGLIDGVGIQAHAFSVDNMSSTQITNKLNLLDDAGLPIHVTELDIRGENGDEAQQRDRYAQIFPAFYEHPAVAGVTLWGYVEGQNWMDHAGILNADGTERLAMQWLKQYMANQPDVCTGRFVSSGNRVAVADIHKTEVHVFPNPMTDQLVLRLKTGFYETVQLSIFNMGGVEVKSICFTGFEQKIDVADLSEGVYIIKLSGDHVKYTTKIIK